MPPPSPMEGALGQLICDRTPYDSMTLPANWQNEVEWDDKTLIWNFRELPRRVRRSMRIPVLITIGQGANAETYLDWLLIGYEGGGGM